MLVHAIPTGSGNLSSLQGALRELGHTLGSFEEETDQKKIRKVLIPGVGSFGQAMQHFEAHGIVPRLSDYVDSGGHVLGICLGMQLLAHRGLEHGSRPGLGFVSGTVKPFRGNSSDETLETHVGFNNLTILDAESPLLRGINSFDDFYFTHSYFLSSDDSSHSAALANHGVDLVAVIDKDNQIFGTQFHPEKSQQQGLRVLDNFVRI